MFGVIGRRTMPVGNVLVGNTRGDIEHDDTALAVDVVSITETTELLLAGGIPHVELNLAEVLCICVRVELSFWWFVSFAGYILTYGGETERVDLDTEGGHILLLELSGQMTLDEGSLCKLSSC